MTQFDPMKYMTKLKGKSYLEVRWRVLWLRTEKPNASIQTEIISFDDKQAVCKATVSWSSPDEGGVSVVTGIGQEEKKDFGDYLEKAETKAIGRALALAGYGTQFGEDLDMGDQVVDAPTTLPALPKLKKKEDS